MQTLLYIDLREKNDTPYEKEIIRLLTSKFPALISLDIDYKTDNILNNYAQQLVKDSAKCILYIESEEQHAHKIVPFAETYIQNPEKFIVFLEGENSWLKKISKGYSTGKIYDNYAIEEITKLASDFLKTNSPNN